MDFIEQQRKQILDENNNGQERLLSIIESMNKTNTSLNILEPLNGTLDLSVLDKFNIKTIVFSEGNITSIENIPKTVNALDVPSNLLVELDGFPSNMQQLDINHNYIKTLPFNELTVCTHLNISHNYFEKLEELPPLLEELNCSNNKITYINFENNSKLLNLNIEYNSITIIDYYPSSITVFSSENNPSIQYRDPQKTPVDSSESKSKYDFNTSLNEFFKIKSIYEKTLKAKRKKIAEQPMSKRERTLKVAGAVSTCYHCKRLVGMHFTHNNRTYKAYCGSKTDPCKLKIEISCGMYNNLLNYLLPFKLGVIESQENMMKQKMEILFEYKTEAESVKRIEQTMEDYESNSAFYKQLLNKHAALFNDPKKEAEILQIKNEVFEQQEDFKTHMDEYRKTTDKAHVKEAMKIYVEQIMLLKKRLFNLEHEIIEMIEEKDHIRLHKQLISSNGLDFTFFDLPEVKHFVV
jgi:hypothetical protein